MRTGRSYSVRNQLFAQQLESLLEMANLIIEEYGELLFVVHHGEIFLNGARVASTTHGFRAGRTLIAEFARRGIAGFEASGEPGLEEWRGFFELLLDAQVEPGDGLVKAASARGFEHLRPVLRVIEEPSTDGGDGPGRGSGSPDATGAPSTLETRRGEEPVPVGALGGRICASAAAALGAAPKSYSAAVAGLTSLLTSTNAQRGLEFRHARRVVQPIVDAASSRAPIVLGLAGLARRDEYTYARNVNACLIATAIGDRLGMDRATLSHLSVAALLHGIGRAVTTDPAQVGPAGALLLARRANMQELTVRAMRVAYEVGSQRATPGKSSTLSQIVAIASTYSRMNSARSDMGMCATPAQVLGMIIGPCTGGFDPALKAMLVETLGYHPPGQYVQLDDGTIAIVIATSHRELARPIVQPVRGPGGVPFDPALHWNGGALPPERTVQSRRAGRRPVVGGRGRGLARVDHRSRGVGHRAGRGAALPESSSSSEAGAPVAPATQPFAGPFRPRGHTPGGGTP